jgi:hypothetical protein
LSLLANKDRSPLAPDDSLLAPVFKKARILSDSAGTTNPPSHDPPPSNEDWFPDHTDMGDTFDYLSSHGPNDDGDTENEDAEEDSNSGQDEEEDEDEELDVGLLPPAQSNQFIAKDLLN